MWKVDSFFKEEEGKKITLGGLFIIQERQLLGSTHFGVSNQNGQSRRFLHFSDMYACDTVSYQGKMLWVAVLCCAGVLLLAQIQIYEFLNAWTQFWQPSSLESFCSCNDLYLGYTLPYSSVKTGWSSSSLSFDLDANGGGEMFQTYIQMLNNCKRQGEQYF